MARRRRLRLVIDTMVVIRGARAFRQQPPVPTTAELQLLLGWIDDETLFDWLYSPPILDAYRTIPRRLKVPAHAAGRFLNLLGQAGIAVEARDLGPFSAVSTNADGARGTRGTSSADKGPHLVQANLAQRGSCADAATAVND